MTTCVDGGVVRRRARRVALALAVAASSVGGACAEGPPSNADSTSLADPVASAVVVPGSAAAPGSAVAATIPGVNGTLVITRQRDLIDRGLINVMTTNQSGVDLLIVERQLVADGFRTSPAAPRTVKIGDGRQVAIQVPYGTAVDCGGDPVTARTDGSHSFTFGDGRGTILVAARRDDARPLTLDATTPVVEIPVTFSVNRCDPHALAEVTRRYGLDLEVGVDGAEPVAVSLPVDDLVDDLEAIVEECRTRTGQ